MPTSGYSSSAAMQKTRSFIMASWTPASSCSRNRLRSIACGGRSPRYYNVHADPPARGDYAASITAMPRTAECRAAGITNSPTILPLGGRYWVRLAESILSKDHAAVGKKGNREQRSPFAPAPLQGLRRYYGLLRPCAPLRYSHPRGWSRLRLAP